jgi:RecA-family ATPase
MAHDSHFRSTKYPGKKRQPETGAEQPLESNPNDAKDDPEMRTEEGRWQGDPWPQLDADPGPQPGDPGPRPNGADRPQPDDGFFTMADLAELPVPPREWHVPELIPCHTVTMLFGDGGVGKSILAMQLAVATALGRPWIGREVRAGRALYISAEDDRDELHRRLADIARADGVNLADGAALSLRSLAGENALLAMLERKTGGLATTPLFDELDSFIARDRPALVCLDTLADLHSGDETIRTQARQFVGILRGIGIRHRCAMFVLAHPSLSGLASGRGTSGSTGWNNSIRSRLYLEHLTADGDQPDPDRRILTTKKANYGRSGGQIELTWREGVFVADGEVGLAGLDRMAAAAKAERVFMKLLRDFAGEGRHVGHSPSTAYAPALFAQDPRAEGVPKKALEAAMRSLFASQRIRVEEFGRPSKRRQRIVETPEGDALKCSLPAEMSVYPPPPPNAHA